MFTKHVNFHTFFVNDTSCVSLFVNHKRNIFPFSFYNFCDLPAVFILKDLKDRAETIVYHFSTWKPQPSIKYVWRQCFFICTGQFIKISIKLRCQFCKTVIASITQTPKYVPWHYMSPILTLLTLVITGNSSCGNVRGICNSALQLNNTMLSGHLLDTCWLSSVWEIFACSWGYI